MTRPPLISRRTCLRGIGTTLALPLLEVMGWAETAKKASTAAAASAARPPVRLGFMYMPHGVIPKQFWPASPQSFLTNPTPALESLRPIMSECLLMKGIGGIPIAPFNGAPHALELSTWLTAQLPDARQRNKINIAISADQIAANYVGAFTSLPSLELATMPQTHKENQEGLNEGYYSHCSFRSPTQAMPAEINPRSVLNRLFDQDSSTSSKNTAAASGSQNRSLDQSMLDLVIGGARDFRKTLPQDDQHKLDEYLDSVRAVERRIAAIEQRQKDAALEKAGLAPSRHRDSDSAPIEIKIPIGDKRSEYMQVMCDLNVLAFQTDTTRVSTYIGSTPNGVSYPELGFKDEHHSQTHHNNRPEMVAKVQAITAFNISQFAYMVKKMHALREGDGTLLDNCIMMWGSGLEDGNKHSRENLPFILAGKGGGSIRTGRFLTDVKGNQGDLLTTLLSCMGVPLDRTIGIATQQIAQIKA
jgi:23S rRNA pseudoU1915 N3-methylase RlmH